MTEASNLVPGSNHEGPQGTEFAQAFIIMEVEMAIQFYRLGDRRTDKIVNVIPPTVELEIRLRCVNNSDKSGIATQTKRGIARQTVVNEILGSAAAVNHAVSS